MLKTERDRSIRSWISLRYNYRLSYFLTLDQTENVLFDCTRPGKVAVTGIRGRHLTRWRTINTRWREEIESVPRLISSDEVFERGRPGVHARNQDHVLLSLPGFAEGRWCTFGKGLVISGE